MFVNNIFSASQNYIQLGMLHSTPRDICRHIFWTESGGMTVACAGIVSVFYTIDTDGRVPDSKAHGANMGPTWVLSSPSGPHVGPMNLAIKGVFPKHQWERE